MCNIDDIIKVIASKENVTSESVYKEIQKAIDIAWQSENTEEVENQKRIFPVGKPSIDEFLHKIYGKIKED